MTVWSEEEQVQFALNRAFFYLKFRPRTEKEVRDYLIKKSEKFQWSPVIINKVILSLKEKNFINDANFVGWFVAQRATGKPKSQFALSYELQKFGVAKDTTTEFFQNNPIEETELAYEALRRRWPRYQHLDRQERFNKAAAFLAGRGFGFTIIKDCIKKMTEEIS